MTELKRLHRHMLPTAVLGVDMRSDGSTLYAACMDGVYEVNAESGAARQLYTHDRYASRVALLEKAGTLVSAGYDGALKWYDLTGGKLVRTVKAHNFWSWSLAVSPDGKYVASVTGQYLSGGPKYEPAPETEPSVKVFDAATGALVGSFSHVPSVQSVAFSPDSRYVAAGNLMGEVRVWDVPAGKQVASWTTDSFTSWGIIKSHCYLGGIFGMAFAPGGEELIVCGMGPMRDPMAGNGKQLWQRFAWKESPAKMVAETKASESGEGLMEALAVHPGGSHFVMSGRLRGGSWNTGLFSLADGALQHSLKTDTRVTGAAFTADGSRLALGGTRSQPMPKDGKIEPFGHVDLFEVTL
ncbi:MAG: WD40 repeat domain-containing protein [Armatimonadota bacterium]